MSVIDDYLSKLVPSQKAALGHIRRLVKSIIPEAEEAIGYGMPAFKYKGTYVLYFAAFKHHMSVYPGSGDIIDKLDMDDHKVSKGTIQFTEDHPLSDDLVKTLVQARLDEINSKS